MTKELTFDIRFASVPAYDQFGGGKGLAEKIRDIYKGKGLEIPDDFDSALTTPPVHYMQVLASDDVNVDELREVDVPGWLNIEILETHD
ncbi:uncharacterized protein DSM5745_05150 [Aspergillus mulundensis]|uniref:Uncharacterized protein n=1 Tax=Aspergillus mulundensis TaxID=1810919 RepID=A0A3D8S5K7_9EURO|nr:Uncharacterized protein DSM5745_05150 [Aspergillus mulundensis]RDW81593.1 Uncharacterized protein DSM5745_05150 [Aspergillus mulundensis]